VLRERLKRRHREQLEHVWVEPEEVQDEEHDDR
jgi:hypothetical protein